MNIKTFSPKVTQPSALRVSERRRNQPSQNIDRTFFKKVYKPKAIKCQNVLELNKDNIGRKASIKVEHNLPFELAAQKVFVQLPLCNRQAKTVQILRVKRLKKILSHQSAMELAYSMTSPLSRNLLLTVDNSKNKQLSVGKSLFAQSRIRDSTGRFAGDGITSTKKHSSDASTMDHGEGSHSTTIFSRSDEEILDFKYRRAVFDFSKTFFSELNSVIGSCEDIEEQITCQNETYTTTRQSSSYQLDKAGELTFTDSCQSVGDTVPTSNTNEELCDNDFNELYWQLHAKSDNLFFVSVPTDLIRNSIDEKEKLDIDDFLTLN